MLTQVIPIQIISPQIAPNRFYYALLLSAVLSLTSSHTFAGEYCGPQSAMGRWVPDIFSTGMSPHKAYLGRACFAHDQCYQTTGVNRAFCDAQFAQHLRDECQLAYDDVMDTPSKLACYAVASGFVASVRQFGQAYFERSQINSWQRLTSSPPSYTANPY